MESIILAGGLGTRLRESVPGLPKPLAPINGAPFLDILLGQLAHFQIISNVVMAIGYKACQIIDYYKEKKGSIPICFSLEETPLGTGGALKKALLHTSSEFILALNGDSYLDFSLLSLIEKQRLTGADIVIATLEVDDASRYGKLLVDKNDQILSFQEKSTEKEKGLINGGAYLIKRSIFEDALLKKPLFEGPFSLEKDLFPLLLQKKMFACPFNGTFIDIGTPDSFKQAQTLLHQLTQVPIVMI